VLGCGIHFDEPLSEEFTSIGYVSDPDFHHQLFSLCCRGMSGPDGVVGHRIQPELLDETIMWQRAASIGRSMPHTRSVYPALFSRVRFLKKSPLRYRLVHGANLAKSPEYYFVEKGADKRRPALVPGLNSSNRAGTTVLATITTRAHPSWLGDT